MSNATAKAQHTPGPWKVVCGDNPNDFIVLEPTGNTICEPNEPLFSDLDPELEPGVREITQAEALANAHLIAAAPEMYEALMALHQGFIDGSIKFTKKRQADSDPYHPANTLMTAAIAKAEGRQ